MLVIDRKLLGPDGMPGPELLGTLLRRHAQERVRLDEIGEIYARRHRITSRRRLAGLPNNRLAHDLPGYIATMAAGYLVGSPVRYAPPDGQEDAFEAVRRAYGEASVESVDAELAMDAAVYGKAVELCYADALARPRVAQMDPRSSFVVYDDTVEHAPLFGVACRDLMDEQLRRRGERSRCTGRTSSAISSASGPKPRARSAVRRITSAACPWSNTGTTPANRAISSRSWA